MAPRIGIALGGGAARGWAHIGVLRALAELGIQPHVVSGASVGSLVGAAYAGNRLASLESWVQSLSGLDVLKLLDARLAGGVIEGNRVMQAVEQILPDVPIEQLERPFAAVATDMQSGQPVWLRSGSTTAAVRASCALPGLMPPRRIGDTWLLDGGLVDPVPVTLCRVLGAETVIAVNLSAYRHRRRSRGEWSAAAAERASGDRAPGTGSRLPWFRSNLPIPAEWRGYAERLKSFVGEWLEPDERDVREPGLFDVMAASINIMQERITRARLAGDPPEFELAPDLEGIGLMDFHKATDAIAAGVRAVLDRAQDFAELARA